MKNLLKTTAVIALLATTACSFSEGDRAGRVVKLSKKGVIFKTLEGELATLAAGASGTMMTNTFHFSVKSEAIAEKLKASMRKGYRVNLSYEEEFFVFPWEADTKYIITAVNNIED